MADAVDLARAAAESDAAAGEVGDHLGCDAEDQRVVTHYFESLAPGYRGWRWAVTVVRAPRAKEPTIDEVVLLPGPDALLAPPWLPWQERLRPGDLGVGDVLPTPADDPRLVPVFFDTTSEDEEDLAFELGLGRSRTLSAEGRESTADRWQSGPNGPDAPIARAVTVTCATCGFFLPLSGALGLAFGACANEFAPDDGRVVSIDHGCGAHSEIVAVTSLEEPGPLLLDEIGFESAVAEHDLGSVTDADSAEPFGHS